MTIHRVNLLIANAYIVRGPKTVLVDTGTEAGASRILRSLDRLGIPRRDISLILLTHAHSDHAGSAGTLREALQVPVAVHGADADMLQRGDNGRAVSIGFEAALSKRFVKHTFPGITADILLDAGTDLGQHGLSARLLHTPGHSPGSISLLFGDGEAIVGDILRGGMLGGVLFSGQPHLPYFMYSLTDKPALFDSIQRVLAAGAKSLYCGHGGPIRADVAARWLEGQRQRA